MHCSPSHRGGLSTAPSCPGRPCPLALLHRAGWAPPASASLQPLRTSGRAEPKGNGSGSQLRSENLESAAERRVLVPGPPGRTHRQRRQGQGSPGWAVGGPQALGKHLHEEGRCCETLPLKMFAADSPAPGPAEKPPSESGDLSEAGALLSVHPTALPAPRPTATASACHLGRAGLDEGGRVTPPRSRRAGQWGPRGLEEVKAAASPGGGRACLPGPISWGTGSDPQVGTLSSPQ